MERPTPSTETVRVAGPDRVATWLLAGTAVFLTLAVAKPWAGVAASPDRAADPSGGAVRASIVSQGSLPSGPPAVGPLESPSPTLPPGAVPCFAPQGWRLVTLERWTDREIRTWTLIVPATGAGVPADPRIPVVPIVSDGLVGVGTCAPVTHPDRPPDPPTLFGAWELRADAAVPALGLALEPLMAIVPGAAALYHGPRYELGTGRGRARVTPWPPGRYALEFASPSSIPGITGSAIWIGLLVQAPGR